MDFDCVVLVWGKRLGPFKGFFGVFREKFSECHILRVFVEQFLASSKE